MISGIDPIELRAWMQLITIATVVLFFGWMIAQFVMIDLDRRNAKRKRDRKHQGMTESLRRIKE